MKASSRKKLALIFALMLAVSIAIAPSAFAFSSIATYYDDDFDTISTPGYVAFSVQCDYIAILVTCEDDANGNSQEDDHMVCYIDDLEHNGLYSMAIPLSGDGTVYNIYGPFPDGIYLVYFTGTQGIVKDYARVVFSTNEY